MPSRVNHGGGCCGINHIRTFGVDGFGREQAVVDTRNDVVRLVREMNRGMAAEVVLTNRQLSRNDSELSRMLTGLGFELVYRFKNPNSGNVCNVFYYSPYKVLADPTFDLTPDTPPVFRLPFPVGSMVRATNQRLGHHWEVVEYSTSPIHPGVTLRRTGVRGQPVTMRNRNPRLFVRVEGVEAGRG